MEAFGENDPQDVKIWKNTFDRRKKKKYIHKPISNTACAVALCSVKDDFSSKGKTLKFDCSPGPNPATDHNKT